VDSRQLARLPLICPACRAAGRGEPALALGRVLRADGTDLVEAILHCPEPACLREHPIVDGVPIVVADLPAWARHQLDAVLRRRDLSAAMTSLLGDAAGPATVLDDARRTAATYATAHYDDAASTSYVALARAALALAPPTELALDVGCATGRGAFELAAAGAGLAVGVDLDFHMLAIAERARTTGVVRFERRRTGVVYEPREAVAPAPRNVAFVCADALNLPLRAGAAHHASALNLLDCVADPARLVAELHRAVAPSGNVTVATPYDWSAGATPLHAWLGGHSQRADHAGAPAPALRHALAAAGLDVVAERDDLPWRLRIHDRATMEYAVHLVHARKPPTE
jgi:SAM-dependent methyltransferase